MQSIFCGPAEAGEYFSETGFDRGFRRAALGCRAICRLTSRVDMPAAIPVPTDRPMMIAANHSSLFDLIASILVLDHFGLAGRFAVNSRFFSNPAAGAFLRSIGCIPFSRDHREQAEQTMVDALLAGQVTGIMPEGRITRIEDQVDGVGPARPGLSRIARRSGAAVLPLGFVHSDVAWRPGKPLPTPRLGRHHVLARAGQLIELTTDDHSANATVVMGALGSLVLEGRALGS